MPRSTGQALASPSPYSPARSSQRSIGSCPSTAGDFVRISGRDRDTLQSVIKLLRESDFGIDMQFTNYRTN